MTEIFHYKKKMIVKFNYLLQHAALVVTEGYHILLSPLNRLVICHFIMSRMYIIRTSWEHNQRKGKCNKR